MKLTWDEAKRAANLEKHGVDFAAIEAFDWATALVLEDTRKDYGETRLLAMGLIEGRLHALVFARRADGVRVISLRKANSRERRRYEERAKAEESR